MAKIHFSKLKLKEIETIFQKNNIPKYRGKQVFEGIYNQFAQSFDDINNIPKDLKQFLNQNFNSDIPEIVEKSTSPDRTTKYLLKLHDNNLIECVYLPYQKRNSLCISTQIGCPVGCVFCASGAHGFVRNLNLWEIIGQLLAVQSDIKQKLTHIVYMGIGEPLLNLDNLVASVKLINENFNISERRITISTSGITSLIYKLAEYKLDITLALSLHSPFQEEREKLIPTAQRNPLPKLFSACDEYFKKTKRRITWEYILIEDINSDEYHARELSKLAKKYKAHINLIPCNKTDNYNHNGPSEKEIKSFTAILEKNNVQWTLRQKKGQSENSACGQLRANHLN